LPKRRRSKKGIMSGQFQLIQISTRGERQRGLRGLGTLLMELLRENLKRPNN
jgi:hypothetical protein